MKKQEVKQVVVDTAIKSVVAGGLIASVPLILLGIGACILGAILMLLKLLEALS